MFLATINQRKTRPAPLPAPIVTPQRWYFPVERFSPTTTLIYHKRTNLVDDHSRVMNSLTQMSLTSYVDWRALLVLPVILVLVHYIRRDPRRKSLPPQVRGWPIINQTFLQVKDDPTGILRQWAKEYGEVFMTKSGTTTFIWLNTMESVRELFDRRSNIYSDRQPMPMALDAARFVSWTIWGLIVVAEIELRS